MIFRTINLWKSWLFLLPYESLGSCHRAPVFSFQAPLARPDQTMRTTRHRGLPHSSGGSDSDHCFLGPALWVLVLYNPHLMSSSQLPKEIGVIASI